MAPRAKLGSEEEPKVAKTADKRKGASEPDESGQIGTEPVEAIEGAAETEETKEIRIPPSMKVRNVVFNIGKAFGKVVNWYAKLTEIGPADLVAHSRKKAKAALQKEHFTEAADEFARLVKLRPADAEACYMLGYCLGKAGRSSEAITWLKKASELNPEDADTHFQLGLLSCQEDQLHEAELEFSRVTEILPDEPKGHYRLGIVYDKMEEYEEAMSSLERALALNPQSSRINQRLGFVCEGKGDHAEALKYFKKAAELEDSGI